MTVKFSLAQVSLTGAALLFSASLLIYPTAPAHAQDAMAADALPSLAPAPSSASTPASADSASGNVFVPAAAAAPAGTSDLPGAAPSGISAMGAAPAAMGATGMGAPMGGVTGSVPGAGGIMQSPATPQVVTDAVTGLQGTSPINLDDMIRAQDAINRLDLMLEIEKRQTELKKLRDERNKPASAFGASIPASALSLPPMTASAPRMRRSDDEGGDDMGFGSSSGGIDKYSLKRITGSEGRYAAVLDNGTKVQSVRPGDRLSDDVKIKSVTLTSVTLTKGKKTKTLSVPTDSYIVRETSGANP